MNKNIEEYQNLCELIWYHNKLYYNDHAPEISDTEYDKLLKKLEQIESENPHLINPASPTQKVSEGLTSGFKTVKHSKPMLSLTNTYSKLELEKFVKRVQKLVGREDLSFTAELKMDGIAVSVIYKDGQLYKAATRGDGVQGDDITNNIFAIKGLPKKLELPNPPKLIELRGEVFMQHEVFESLNSDKLAAGLTAWANPRNAAAGSLKLLDANETAKRGLSIAFYSIANALELQIESQLAAVKFIKELKLPVIDLFSHASNLAELWDYISLVETKRAGLPFDIDGVVIKLDSISEQLKLGATGKSPRWAIAYKFASLQATTRIHSITLQVGRTGIITPVAELEPVKLSGSTISRATLHNFDEIARKDIREGDIVTIEKGGDVIPKVVAPLIAKRAAGIGIYQLPTHCPSCKSQLIKEEGEIAYRCPNSDQCREQLIKKLVHFVSKQAFDINHLGVGLLTNFFNLGLVKRPSDIFQLKFENLQHLEGFKEKSISNLLNSIQECRKISLTRFIYALGIRHVGINIAELLAQNFQTVQLVKSADLSHLIDIEGVGEKIAESICEFFQKAENILEIENLLASGVEIEPQAVISFADHFFKAKTVVLTGSLKNFTRQKAGSLIKERGGKVVSAVTKNCDLLVVGEDPGSKFSKAESLSIKVINEQQFIELLGESYAISP